MASATSAVAAAGLSIGSGATVESHSFTRSVTDSGYAASPPTPPPTSAADTVTFTQVCVIGTTSTTSTAPVLTNEHYGEALVRTSSLMISEDEAVDDNDESLAWKPTDEALARTKQMLAAAVPELGVRFPRVSGASTGPGRSIRVTWAQRGREVRLVVGGTSANRSYIYRREGSHSHLEEFVSGESLAACLTWLAIP